jgi:iron(III) transport system substrate-binding protein
VAPAAAVSSGAPGYRFVGSHAEIVEKARAEGALKVLSSADPKSIKVIKDEFTKKYPFIKFDIQEITGTDAAQRFAIELKAGAAKEWDAFNIDEVQFKEMVPYMEKVDLLGMAEQGILGFNPKMVYAEGRNMMAAGTQIGIAAYNKTLVPPERVPKTWEDLLRPEWKGRKMLTEIRPNSIVALLPAKGEAWLRDFARKMREQEPIWSRGNTRALTAMSAGEYMLHSGTYFHTVQREIQRGSDTLAIAVLEPVPVRMTLGTGLQAGAKNFHAALLYVEFMGGPEGQRILDEVEPLKGSLFNESAAVARLLSGKQTSIVGWDLWPRLGDLEKEIVEGFGLPKAEVSE